MLKFNRCFIWVFLLILAVSLINPVQGSSYGYRVTPSTLSFEIEPGRTSSQVITITSIASTDIVVEVTVAGIIKDWISINQTGRIRLGPDESKAINVQVTVPNDAEPGNHMGAVNFHQVVEEEGSTTVVAGTGVTATVIVPGLVIETGEIVSFPKVTIADGEEEVLFNVSFKNTGTITTRATASVRILNSGRHIVAEGSAHVTNPVKPNKTMLFVVSCPISDLPAGNYTSIATVSFGEKATESETWLYIKPEYVYVPPMPITWMLPYMVIAVLIAVIAIILILYRERRWRPYSTGYPLRKKKKNSPTDK